jgi:hypothetical protein
MTHASMHNAGILAPSTFTVFHPVSIHYLLPFHLPPHRGKCLPTRRAAGFLPPVRTLRVRGLLGAATGATSERTLAQTGDAVPGDVA